MSGIATQAGMFSGGGVVDYLTNLVSYYRLEETGAIDRLDSFSTNHLTPTNTAPNRTGIIGNALDLVGIAGSAMQAATSSVHSYTGAFSMSLWAKRDAGVSDYIIGKWDVSGGGGDQIAVYLTSGTNIQFAISADGLVSAHSLISSMTMTAGVWYHIFVCYDPSNAVRLYVDGVLDVEVTTSVVSSLHAGDTTLMLGGRGDNETNSRFDGAVDEFAVWDAYRPELALPLYNAGAGVGFYDFDLTTHDIAKEENLTLTNSFPTGSLNDGEFNRGQNCIFACALTIPTTPQGCLMELGSSARACYVGFRAGGTFVVRAGDGDTTTANTKCAILEVTSGQPSGTGVLLWEFDPVNGTVRAWWNGTLLGSAETTDSTSFESTQWAAASNGSYGTAPNSIPDGEDNGNLGATILSPLRYYQNQLIT